MAEKVVRKRATKNVATKTTARKAPTRTESSAGDGQRSLAPFIAIGFFALVVGVSVFLGLSDSGQINVADTLQQKRDSGTDEEREQLKNIPVQNNKPKVKDGGLVPTTDVNPQVLVPTPADSASSTASSTDASATSTEAVADEGGEVPTEETATTDTPAETTVNEETQI